MKKIEKPIGKTYGCMNSVYAASAVQKCSVQIISNILQLFYADTVAFCRFQALSAHCSLMCRSLAPYVYLHKCSPV